MGTLLPIAFIDYRVGAVTRIGQRKEDNSTNGKGQKVDIESSGLSKREWNELMTSFGFTEKIV